MNKQLEFRAREHHPFVYITCAFGLILLATGVLGVCSDAAWVLKVVACSYCFVFGATILASAGYVFWGRLRIEVEDGWCVVTWMLGPWRRTKRFPRADVRSVRRYKPPPNHGIIQPSSAGRQLRIDIRRERRPLDVGGGFHLDDAALQSIEDLLCTTR